MLWLPKGDVTRRRHCTFLKARLCSKRANDGNEGMKALWKVSIWSGGGLSHLSSPSTCVVCYLEMFLGFPEKGLAQYFSHSVTFMFVSRNKEKDRPLALAVLVLYGLYEIGL